jgi:hypothetical protein
MYNGNSNGNGQDTYTGSPYSDQRPPYSRPPMTIAGMPIKPVFLWVLVAAVVVLAIWVLMSVLNTSLVMHFSLFSGILLLLANVRELIGQSHMQRSSTALLNVMIGAALVFAWVSQIFGALFWAPAILLIIIATPLAFSRASVYTFYAQAARNAYTRARAVVGR